MFRVVTVAGECGSGRDAIGAKTAQRLGWRLLDKSMIETIARSAQVDPAIVRKHDERVDSWWHRIKWRNLWSGRREVRPTARDAQYFDAETMAALAGNLIASAAQAGECVIVGHGAQCVLQGCHEALHVFMYAPWAKRVNCFQIDKKRDIGCLVKATDAARAAYIRTYFASDWKNPCLYHMMLNSLMGEEMAVQVIVDTVARSGRCAVGLSYHHEL